MMLEGQKLATQSLMNLMDQQSVIANNLANSTTVGYQRDVQIVGSFSETFQRQMALQDGMQQVGGAPKSGMGGLVSRTATIFEGGTLKPTNNDFDLALGPPAVGPDGKKAIAFFTVKTPFGALYTRNGNFKVDGNGYLVTGEGYQVMGDKGPINLGKVGTNFKVKEDGTLTIDDKDVAKLQLTEFTNTRGLVKKGSYIEATGESLGRTALSPRVQQGVLEMANVNLMKEMVNMMVTQRAAESAQKLIQTQDQLNQKVIGEVGRLR